jgi:ferredoxin--NADP+ reductase
MEKTENHFQKLNPLQGVCMLINNSDLGTTFDAKVTNSWRITPDNTDEVREMVLEVNDPSFQFTDGQSISVIVHGPHDFGNKYHIRRYSVSRVTDAGSNSRKMSLLVKRCFYTDEINGEQYPGVASNFLCDRSIGDAITISGPFNSPFSAPEDRSSNLLMIGTGTGISPFRTFIKNIYDDQGGWDGKVTLFYGAETGLELYYLNDVNSDLSNYYSEESYKAFTTVAGRPLMGADEALQQGLEDNAQMVWELMQEPNTHVYMAGLAKIADALEQVMVKHAGSQQAWETLKNRLIAEKRWSKLLYID